MQLEANYIHWWRHVGGYVEGKRFLFSWRALICVCVCVLTLAWLWKGTGIICSLQCVVTRRFHLILLNQLFKSGM